MKILYDRRAAIGKTTSGIPEYTRMLLRYLSTRSGDSDEYSVFFNSFRKKTVPEEVQYACATGQGGEVVDWGIPNKAIELFSETIGIPKTGIFKKYDVLFRPHFLPLRGVRTMKDIVVFHDLSFARFPHFFSPRKRLWHRYVQPRKQAMRADKIITVSSSTRTDITDLWGISPNKVSVVHSGINPFFREDVSKEDVIEFKKAHGLENPFFLFVGTIEPRKNIAGAIRIFEKLKEKKFFRDFKFVIVGPRGWLSKPIFDFAARSKRASDIKFWGFASFEDLRNLYHSAFLLLYPSFYEGFGFPPLECEACGSPVAASDIGVFRETLGGSAMLIPARDEDGFVSAIEGLADSPKRMSALIKAGKQNSERFRWETAADKISKIIHEEV